MEKHYLIIPHLQILNANAASSPITVGFPSMPSWLGMAHALERNIHQRYDYLKDISLPRLAISCHSFNFRAFDDKKNFTKSLIGSSNPLVKNNKGVFERPPFIEEAHCHLNVTLLFELNGITETDILDSVLDAVKQELPLLKAAGGDIICSEKDLKRWKITTLSDDERFYAITNKLLPGTVLIERSDLMKYDDGDHDALDNLFETLNKKKDAKGWLVPINVGYKDLSGAIEVSNQRDYQYEHHFAEPVLTIGEFIPPYRIQSLDDIMWEYKYIPSDGLYLCKNNFVDSNNIY